MRSGSDVSRTGYDRLEDALVKARAEAERIVATAPLGKVKAIRDYAPESQTKARIEISGKGFLRPPTAGIDIRGDNSLLGYTGAIRRRPLRPDSMRAIFRALEKELADG